MISVVFQVDSSGDAIARSLVPLVSGSIDGLVKKVIILAKEPGEANLQDLQRLCDYSGAELLTGAACDQWPDHLKGNWVLMLEPGAILMDDWSNGIIDHINQQRQPARFPLYDPNAHLPFWQRLLNRRGKETALKRGCLISRQSLQAIHRPNQTLEAMTRGRSLMPIRSGRLQPA